MTSIAPSLVERRSSDSASVHSEHDRLVIEEPLEVRVFGDTLAVTMRTPGHDRDLVLGFLLAEGIIRARDDVASLTACLRAPNVVDVVLSPGVKPPEGDDAPFARRGTLTTSACGVCGRRSVDDLVARVTPVPLAERVSPRLVTESVAALRARQPIFEETGGCHAASLVRFDGEVVATAEDVGRHNAVDKVVGARIAVDALPLAGHLLVVSGRSSFEIVQKAAVARVPVVASVSAPTSLAVDLARAANVTLLGFARGASFTVYAARERVA